MYNTRLISSGVDNNCRFCCWCYFHYYPKNSIFTDSVVKSWEFKGSNVLLNSSIFFCFKVVLHTQKKKGNNLEFCWLNFGPVLFSLFNEWCKNVAIQLAPSYSSFFLRLSVNIKINLIFSYGNQSLPRHK